MRFPSTLRRIPPWNAALDVASVFASRLGGIVVSLVFIPIYDRLLSPAAFGTVALLLSLQSFFLVSDLGLATVLARETAIARGNPGALRAAAGDRRRAEAIMVAAVLVASLAAAAIMAWQGGAEALNGFRIMGATALIAFLVLLNIAQLCLNALSRYRLTSILTVGGTVARAAGSIVALTFVEASVDVFVWSQLLIAAGHYVVTRIALDRSAGVASPGLAPLLDWSAMRRLLMRCRAVMVYTLGGAAALNLDKTILATFLPIQLTGWYFLATTYALVPIAVLSGPLNQYFAPRVAHAEAQSDLVGRLRLATGFQLLLIAAVILPTFVLVRQAPVLIPLWLHDNPAVPQIVWLASILLVGTAIGATGYYPTTFLIAAADNAFLARLSAGSSVVVLAAATGWAIAGSLTGVALSYAAFHAFGCLAQWFRLRRHWQNPAYRHLVLDCYLGPVAALLAACILSWGIAVHAASGWAAILVEVALQLLLGAGIMAIVSHRCYRRAASPALSQE